MQIVYFVIVVFIGYVFLVDAVILITIDIPLRSSPFSFSTHNHLLMNIDSNKFLESFLFIMPRNSVYRLLIPVARKIKLIVLCIIIADSVHYSFFRFGMCIFYFFRGLISYIMHELSSLRTHYL